MSAGKDQPNLTTVVVSSSNDDETAHGPGRLGVNLATSQCQLEAVKRLHNSLDPERDYLERSACQTAAGRALWNHVIHDPLAEIFAGDVFLRGLQEKVRRDQEKNARETAGVMMAVRTLWFDARLAEALARFDSASTDHQVVLLGAGMDARAYRLRSLNDCAVFEVDSAKALHFKEAILQAMVDAGEPLPHLEAKSIHRVPADIASENWFSRLTAAGFEVHLPTVWILEGFLYYLQEASAKETLKCITQNSMSETVMLADFMNESSTHLAHELKTHFYFHSDWPEDLLPMLGFSQVKVSQIGDPDANFGLINDELNLFHQMRRVSRHVKADVNGKPYMRLFLVESWAHR
ncbi:hypothetical protein M758_1G306900 [Ceratodon purpureus]|nr:hypothetical protein M758_1G306900 [Ceratodon purpureus]